MIIEIISTGEELVSGAVIDKNSSYISSKLESIGLLVRRHTVVGDDKKILSSLFLEVSKRADITIVTGGLGPTSDDITAEAVSEAAKVKLDLHNEALKSMEIYFSKKNLKKTVVDTKQAMLPIGSKCIINMHGTAPGFSIKINKCTFFFMPGVPEEMKQMLDKSVQPIILSMIDNKNTIIVKTFSLFGLPEAVVGEILSKFNHNFPDIKLGFRAKFPTIDVKLTANINENQIANELMAPACNFVMKKIGKWVFATDGKSLEEVVGNIFNEKKITLAVAESCTGGLIGNMLTDVAGSSNYFLFSGVTYSNKMKEKVLGVSKETLIKYGAVHEETVKQMANGARQLSGADYAIATSGIAGPGGGTSEKPVGTLCIGFASKDTVEGFRICLSFDNRKANKKLFATAALDLLRQKILNMPFNIALLTND